VAASLAGCTSPATNSACAAAPSGSTSDSVKVTGKFGAEPTVEFTAPLEPKTTERTVAIKGKDTKYAGVNDEVKLDFALYDGTTGKRLTATGYTKGEEVELPVNEKILHVGFTKTLACATAGSRIVGVIPAADGFGADGSTDLGIAAGESIVFVADVVAVTTGVATGKDQPKVEGMPTVKLAKDGTPTVTVPDADPPADLKIAVLKKGDGKVVADGDTVKLQYQGLIWNTGKVFDQSWDQKGAVSFTTGGVVAGFGQALVGQSVGSQVLVVIPPALGYGTGGNPDAGITGTDTLVFVIDILDTAPTSK
jgi:peptidylprolyl isomerase